VTTVPTSSPLLRTTELSTPQCPALTSLRWTGVVVVRMT
jgi:hypothetical protein